MNRTFETLSQLEKVDKVIADFQKELDALPQELKVVEDEYFEVQDFYNNLKNELEALQAEKKEKDELLEEKKDFVKNSDSTKTSICLKKR